jgi:hypothetical protein
MVALAALIGVAGGYWYGRTASPAHIETNTEARTVEVVRWQLAYASHGEKVEKRQTATVSKPDGTVVVLEGYEATTRWVDDLKVDGISLTDTKVVERTVVDNRQPEWMVGASAQWSLKAFEPRPVWSVEVHKRVLGPLWLGAGVGTDLSVRASASLMF